MRIKFEIEEISLELKSLVYWRVNVDLDECLAGLDG